MTILVIEDDRDISSLLRRGFEAEGYSVDCAATGPAALERARGKNYDAIILDVMLPELSGIEVCQSLRKQGQIATIIMLSARDSVDDRIEGLSAGADDYLIKPFAFKELLARLHAQERRNAPEKSDAKEQPIAAGILTFDPELREVSAGEEKTVLTEREAHLLMLFIRNANKPLSRVEIFDALWADQGGAAVNVVDVYIGYLRRKLSGLGVDAAAIIRTVRGVGYIFPIS